MSAARVPEAHIRLHRAAGSDQQRLEAPARVQGGYCAAAAASILTLMRPSWIFLLFELSLGETRPSAVCLRSSVTPSLRGLVDIAHLFWLHDLGQNRQTNVMAPRHFPGQTTEAVILAHPPSAPNARSVCLFPFSPAHMHVPLPHLCRPSPVSAPITTSTRERLSGWMPLHRSSQRYAPLLSQPSGSRPWLCGRRY